MVSNSPANQKITIFVITVCAVFIYWIVRVATGNEEGRLRRVVYSAVVAVEKKDVAGCVLLLAPDYKDHYGNDKGRMEEIISGLFKNFYDFQVSIKKLTIDIDGIKAQADIGFMVVFKEAGKEQLYYDSGKITAFFKREEKVWKVVSVEYAGSNELLFMSAVA